MSKMTEQKVKKEKQEKQRSVAMRIPVALAEEIMGIMEEQEGRTAPEAATIFYERYNALKTKQVKQSSILVSDDKLDNLLIAEMQRCNITDIQVQMKFRDRFGFWVQTPGKNHRLGRKQYRNAVNRIESEGWE